MGFPQDLVLIKRLKAGDESAFKTVFNLYFKKLYAFSFRYLKNKEYAEDVVQETLLQFWLTRSNLNEEYPITPYLFTIAKRLSLNSLRQIATSKTASENHFATIIESANTTEDDLSFAELEKITNELLQQMPPQQQLVYKMSRIQGMSLDEIASELGILKNTVKKHLAEAMKFMRMHLPARYSVIFFTILELFKK